MDGMTTEILEAIEALVVATVDAQKILRVDIQVVVVLF